MERVLRAALLLVFVFAPAVQDLGAQQVPQTARGTSQEADEPISDRIREAWAEVHRLQRNGNPGEAEQRQRELAAEFFAYYGTRPASTPGRQALATAFRMWGMAGDDEAIESAMRRVDRGFPHWESLILSARPAFASADRLDEFRVLVADLAGTLTDSAVASEVWITLGRDYRNAGDGQRAAECFRRAIELDADPVLVRTARTALDEVDRVAVGRAAPGFTVSDLRGRPVRLGDLAGKVVLLQFWSTDCRECFLEFDRLQQIRREYSGEDLELIGVAIDPRVDAVRRVVEARKVAWPQICDGQAWDGFLARLYEVRELPGSVLIDRGGTIVARDLFGEQLGAAITALLEGHVDAAGHSE